MAIDTKLTDEALLRVLGERVAALRVAANLTQAQLAEQAGLGVRTVQRLELGASATQLSGFLRICRVLGILERFDAFLPESTPSPMAQLHAQGRKRQRVRARKVDAGSVKKWAWGADS